MAAAKKRAPAVALNILARPGAAPARSTPVEDLPRPVQPSSSEPPRPSGVGGIKDATIGTTLYLLPAEHKRVKRLALDLDVTVHELLLMGLDRLLRDQGQTSLERYAPPRPKKGIPRGVE